MADTIRITTPFTKEMSRKLKAGDSVLITGTIISARDAAHKVMTEALARGEKLPVDWTNQIVYYLGPTPAKPGDPIGSCGPTTSGRMDAYTPTMLDQGITGMIGKGSRTKDVVDSMKKNGATYFAAVGGAAALIAKSVKIAQKRFFQPWQHRLNFIIVRNIQKCRSYAAGAHRRPVVFKCVP